ncbi:MAG: C25 family cysteine peptidase [Ginsengibacter sp.]
MKPVKLIVTNKSKLEWKYGKKLSKINSLLKQMQAADKKKGLDTRVAFVDNAASLKSAGVKKINTDAAKEYKRVVDDLYKKYTPAYIVILGASDIVPFQLIDNPAEDEDATVESDLPYACDMPYSKNITNFTGPTRVVGRIPDIMGKQDDITYLQKVITNSINHMPLSVEKYYNYFSVTALVWKKSTELSLQSIFGQSTKMTSAPHGKIPKSYTPYSKRELSPLTHFYNCHGASFDLSFYGQKGNQYPEALQSSNLSNNIAPGTIVASECCYGAQLFDPKQQGLPQQGIGTNYLANDAIAFLGSSTIAYGPADSQGLADLITQFFIKNILTGSSTGRAFLEARQRFLTEVGPDLDPFELKTIAQFYLLGDPSVQPAECEEAEVVSLSVGTAIANSRKNLFMKGITLAGSIGVTKKLQNASPLTTKLPLSNNKTMNADDILQANKFNRDDKKAVYSVKPKATGFMGLQKKFGGNNVKYHTYVQNPMKKIKHIRILVVKENSSQILGWKVYESR